MTQKELGERIGLSQSVVSQIETGAADVTPALLPRIAAELDLRGAGAAGRLHARHHQSSTVAVRRQRPGSPRRSAHPPARPSGTRLRGMMKRLLGRATPTRLVVSVVTGPVQATEGGLSALGFDRSLSEHDLLRAWRRQTLTSATGAKDSGQRTLPRIRRITARDASHEACWPLKPVPGDMARRRDRYASIIDAEAGRHGIDPDLVHAVIRAESAYNPRAKSKAGACGLMQLMPATARRFDVRDLWEPAQDIRGGVAYLRFLLDRFEQDVRLTLAAYNAGEGAVAKYGNRIPPYRETRTSARRVLGDLGAA